MIKCASSVPVTQMDNGKPVRKRAWAFANPNTTPPPDWKCQGADQVFIFSVMADEINKPPTAFDQWDRSSGNQRNSAKENLLQYFWRTVELLRTKYYKKDPQSLRYHGMGIEVMAEMVLADEATAAERRHNDEDGEARRKTAEVIARWYTDAIVDVEQLSTHAHVDSRPPQAHADNADENAEAHRSRVYNEAIKFMRGFEHREVREIRFWLLIKEPTVRFADSWVQVLMSNGEHYSKMTNDDQLAIEKNKHYQRMMTPNSDMPDFSKVLANNERYRLIYDHSSYLVAISVYLRDPSMLRAAFADSVLGGNTTYQSSESPINPEKIFAAQNYFHWVRNSRHTDATQKRIENYFDERSNTWRFPRNVLVMRIDQSQWSIDKMMAKYWPPYQFFHIEPNLDWDENASIRDNQNALIERMRALDVNDGGDDAQSADEEAAQEPEPEGEAEGEEDADNGADEIADDLSFDFAELASDADEAEEERVAANVRQLVERARNGGRSRDAQQRQERDLNTFDRLDNVQAIDMIDVDFADPTVDAQSQQATAATGTASARAHQTHTLRAQFHDAKLPTIEAIRDRNARASARIAMQFNATQQYKYKCTGPQANVSESGRVINLWKRTQGRIGQLRMELGNQFVDPNISFFANLIITIFDSLEDYCGVYTAHGATLRTMLSMLNCYYYVFDKGRLHVIFFGSPATSKSFAIVLSARMFIECTVTRVSSRSRHAGNIDQHELDKAMAMEEMPDNMILEQRDSDDLQNEMKEWMTRGKSRREIKVIDTEGVTGGSQHKQKSLETEKGITIQAATNHDPSKFNPALRDRFDCVHQVARTRIDKSYDAVAAEAESKSSSLVLGRAKFFHLMRMIQVGVYDLEKLMMVGAIKQPTLTVFGLIMEEYRTVLEKKFGITIKRRIIERCRMMVRTLVVKHAVAWLFLSPASDFYKLAYNEWYLVCAEPLLRDTEEIVHFALDMYRDQTIDPNREAVLQCLRDTVVPEMIKNKYDGDYSRMFAPSSETRGAKTLREFSARDPSLNAVSNALTSKHGALGGRFKQPAGGARHGAVSAIHQVVDQFRGEKSYARSTASQTTGANDASSSAQRARQVLSQYREMQSQNENGAKRKRPDEGAAGGEKQGQGSIDCNYLPIYKSLAKLSLVVSNAMKREGMSRELKPDEVERVLRKLGAQQIAAHTYRRRVDRELWPPVEVASTDEQQMDALRFLADGSGVLFHVQLLWAKNDDPHEVAINSVRTNFTPTQKFITALPVRDDLPHLLRMRRMTKSRRKQTVKYGRAKKGLKMSLDEYSAYVRLFECGIPTSQRNLAFFSQIHNDITARQKPNAVRADACDYPQYRVDQVMNDIKLEKELKQKARDCSMWEALNDDDELDPEMASRFAALDPEQLALVNGAARSLITLAQVEDPSLDEFTRNFLRSQYDEQEQARQEEERRKSEIEGASAAFAEDEPVAPPPPIEKPDMPPPPAKRRYIDPMADLGRSNEPGVSLTDMNGTADIIGQLRRFMTSAPSQSVQESPSEIDVSSDTEEESESDEEEEEESQEEASQEDAEEPEDQEEESGSEIEVSSDTESGSEIEVSSDTESSKSD